MSTRIFCVVSFVLVSGVASAAPQWKSYYNDEIGIRFKYPRQISSDTSCDPVDKQKEPIKKPSQVPISVKYRKTVSAVDILINYYGISGPVCNLTDGIVEADESVLEFKTWYRIEVVRIKTKALWKKELASLEKVCGKANRKKLPSSEFEQYEFQGIEESKTCHIKVVLYSPAAGRAALWHMAQTPRLFGDANPYDGEMWNSFRFTKAKLD